MARKKKAPPPKFHYVDITIEGNLVYFGDLVEVKNGCGGNPEAGFKIPMEPGEYRVMYFPTLFLMANKNIPLEEMRNFFEDMFPTGYFEGSPEEDKSGLDVDRFGRMGHCMSEELDDPPQSSSWDLNQRYAICDASIPLEDIKAIEGPKLTAEEPVVASFFGRGAFAIADTEYKYACGGRNVVLSTGYEFPEEGWEEVYKLFEEVWEPPLIKGYAEGEEQVPQGGGEASDEGEKKRKRSDDEDEGGDKKRKKNDNDKEEKEEKDDKEKTVSKEEYIQQHPEREAGLAELVGMGFDSDAAWSALEKTSDNVQLAIDVLTAAN
mmetsp:Transcript_36923/g.58055  ORF Transcript_36923/g.58055 Transcript_36923/m.58055 type:complete len:321 (-) Transcript_36923:38-1000(-)|eukprot:CAMPEP_0201540740 /NCGR_PEP_ID=MMETSP0161_2-20130828/71105_1 /ASSEMBLY_ACC=CAM_ASM_000251 /TAXON_ID=180227 /ORGANISM="Neoparamoeba aestuarina, Strain SoJaBio B1-5/56/2" /LENGTH=320 /DNA_ID=CAMNT_0047948231 /DNA_START=1362 /DNA_END=2324 /DNA_ORIENTATION=+